MPAGISVRALTPNSLPGRISIDGEISDTIARVVGVSSIGVGSAVCVVGTFWIVLASESETSTAGAWTSGLGKDSGDGAGIGRSALGAGSSATSFTGERGEGGGSRSDTGGGGGDGGGGGGDGSDRGTGDEDSGGDRGGDGSKCCSATGVLASASLFSFSLFGETGVGSVAAALWGFFVGLGFDVCDTISMALRLCVR